MCFNNMFSNLGTNTQDEDKEQPHAPELLKSQDAMAKERYDDYMHKKQNGELVNWDSKILEDRLSMLSPEERKVAEENLEKGRLQAQSIVDADRKKMQERMLAEKLNPDLIMKRPLTNWEDGYDENDPWYIRWHNKAIILGKRRQEVREMKEENAYNAAVAETLKLNKGKQ